MTTGGTIVGSWTIGFGVGGPYSLTFTPTATTATFTLTLTYAGTPPRDIKLTGMNLPRFDSFAIENVVTTVCNEDRYHFGFNGQIKDNEWAGLGNHLDFKFRGYDSRTARFISVDPLAKKFPWNSPYVFAKIKWD